ncbi:MAG TPA: ATPase, T2SS/T4P/T4SS family [Burkholderiaceae bacterium]|nr:ATPase, T2SS/T4P/T4SS family [Burkholderiaceae bacterium]
MMWKRLTERQSATSAMAHDAAGGRFDVSWAVMIDGREQLDALQPGVVRSLSEELGVEALAGRMCPVLMTDQRVAVFSLREHVGSDQADELTRRIVQKGHQLAKPARYVLDAPLLLAVARNQLTASVAGPQGGRTEPSHSRTALAAAFQDLVEWGVRHDASDLHLNVHSGRPDSEIRYTIRGQYVAPERFRKIPTRMLSDMLAVIWMDIQGGNGALFDPQIEQQGSLLRRVDNNDVVIRWASLAADTGPSVCLRLLVQNVNPAMRDLGALGYLPDQIRDIERVTMSQGGAIVFAGTVGSGKSTTLATLISRIPADRKVITIEDPVEYRIPNAIQNTVVRALSEASPRAYAAKLRTLKRSAMTDVLLGEVRDRETGQAFMDLAGSGVSLYTTLHAPSAAIVPDRLASDFIGVSRDFLLTPGVLRLIVFQALVPRLCPHCSHPAGDLLRPARAGQAGKHDRRDWARWLEGIGDMYQIDATSMRIRHPGGCDHCGTAATSGLKGYAGRMVVAELIEPALQPDYLDCVHDRQAGQWLLEQTRHLACRGLHASSVWRSAMDNAVRASLEGHIDPRDIERHFMAFETRHHQLQRCGRNPQAVN